MWLLSTDRAELHYFSSPTSVVGGYAILSHTWRDKEESFQDVQRIVGQCKEQGQNPRDHVDSKIRECCKLAERHGFGWVWIDSCCIDKTSSSELSEAINSMFQWYTQSEVCYVFLEDVPSDCVLDAPDSAFRRARWHTRGWTLQELIAPSVVFFMSKDWKRLGAKSDPWLARLLADITLIPSKVLTREAYFFQYCVAVRMGWASRRTTTRLEDEAYSLMGIFQVNIPVMYGEGRRAFQRLQEEIMKTSEDTSIFAWWNGPAVSPDSLDSQHMELRMPLAFEVEDKYLFAPSPQCFRHTVAYTPLLSNPFDKYPPLQTGNDGGAGSVGPFSEVKLPAFSMTSYGIRCEFPVFDAGEIAVAVLLCQTLDSHLGLILHRDDEALDPSRPRYFTGYGCRTLRPPSMGVVIRIVKLGRDFNELRFNGEVYQARWRTIYIVPRPEDYASSHTLLSRLQYNCDPTAPFRIPLWLISTLISLGWDEVREKELGSHAKSLGLFNKDDSGSIWIDLGLCEQEAEPRSHWARVRALAISGGRSYPPHDCEKDHIDSDSWDQLSKEFGEAGREVRLSLTRCRMNPESTYVIHLELIGSVYEQFLRNARIAIPTRGQLCSATRSSESSSAGISEVVDVGKTSTKSSLMNPNLDSHPLLTPADPFA